MNTNNNITEDDFYTDEELKIHTLNIILAKEVYNQRHNSGEIAYFVALGRDESQYDYEEQYL